MPSSQFTKNSQSKTHKLKSLLLGGILPLVAYAWVEDRFGIMWGLIAGMVLGIGEILWEWFSQKKVDPLTWAGNGLLLLLGGISLITQEGIWFKLQPSLFEIAFTFGLWGSLLLKRPLLIGLMTKQGGLPKDWETSMRPELVPIFRGALSGFTFRLGLFFGLHAVLSAWAAFYWSTAAWAALKGIGLTGTLIVYVVGESLVLRYRISTIR